METPPQKLLDQVRDLLRLKHYAYRTEETHVQWIRRYILFHNKRHPKDMGVPEIEAFLSYLATEGHVAASTQNQALSAILFLYTHASKQDLAEQRINAIPCQIAPIDCINRDSERIHEGFRQQISIRARGLLG